MTASLISITANDLERLFTRLAETPDEREAIRYAMVGFRRMRFATRAEMLREIIALSLMLLPPADRPRDWDWMKAPRPEPQPIS